MSDLLSVRKLNAGESFDPPEFGVTVLGASHGKKIYFKKKKY
jgi:hypothetical protein